MALEMRQPKLVASTGSTYNCAIAKTRVRDEKSGTGAVNEVLESSSLTFRESESTETNYFKSFQWSPDGTCLFTNSADNILRTIIVPTDLLSPHDSPSTLSTYSRIISPEPIYSYAAYPHFSLSDPSTTLLITTHRDTPTRLINVLSPTTQPLASYPLISPTTEAYLTPHSLVFLPSGTHFYTGTSDLISLFDISRSGCGPTTRLPTIPSKRHKIKGGGVGMRGIVSALSLQPDADDNGMLAAGTWTRWVGLYDANGVGGTVANWSVESAADGEAMIGGAGVSEVKWSSCGRYLIVVERKSDGVLIYDVRVTGKLVAWCCGRKAKTNQRMAVDVFGGGDQGSEVWAGGVDGVTRVWERVGLKEGESLPDWEWIAHDDVVGGVALHPSGTVAVTCSGSRKNLAADLFEDESSDESEPEDEDGDDTGEDLKSDSESESSSSAGSELGGSSSGTSSMMSGVSSKDLAADNSIKIWSLL